MEENMVIVEEKKGMTIVQKCLVVGGLAVSGVIGFKFGSALTRAEINVGLNKLCEVDPTFEKHFWEAMGKAKASLGK